MPAPEVLFILLGLAFARGGIGCGPAQILAPPLPSLFDAIRRNYAAEARFGRYTICKRRSR